MYIGRCLLKQIFIHMVIIVGVSCKVFKTEYVVGVSRKAYFNHQNSSITINAHNSIKTHHKKCFVATVEHMGRPHFIETIYSIEGIAKDWTTKIPGKYKIKVYSNGCKIEEIEINIEKCQWVYLDFRLISLNGPKSPKFTQFPKLESPITWEEIPPPREYYFGRYDFHVYR